MKPMTVGLNTPVWIDNSTFCPDWLGVHALNFDGNVISIDAYNMKPKTAS